MSGKFRHIEHTADIGIELRGGTREELFEAAAEAVAELLSDENPTRRETREISLEGADLESLLVDFLNELIFLASERGWLAGSAGVKLIPGGLRAVLKGGELPSGISNEIKAATYHRMNIRKEKGQWLTEVLFDV